MIVTSAISRRTLVQGAAAGAVAALGASTAFASEPAAKNRVCEILGIEKPVMQAVMFDLTNPELVAAVSNAGGLGTLAMTSAEQIDAVKALTDKPFAISTYSADEETATALRDAGITTVLVGTVQYPSSDWAIDTSGIEFWKAQGFTVAVKALNTTLEGALATQEAGADILIPVGYGAGGCGPCNRTAATALLAEYKAGGITIPMLAAGGVVDAATAAACATAGAEGAYCGTRFLATEESNCCDEAKQIICDTRSEDLVEIPTSLSGDLFGLVPCTRTPLTEKVLDMMASGATYDEITEFSGTNAQFWMSMSAGNIDEYAVGMDRAVNLVTEVVPAAQVVDEIASAFEA